jgi:myosin heavy subunit
MHPCYNTKSLNLPSGDILSRSGHPCLFEWLVDKINKLTGQDPESRTQIGVLDICGFICFKNKNTNFEQLQNHFNQHVLKVE